MLRLIAGLCLVLFVALPGAIQTATLIPDARQPLFEVADLSKARLDALPDHAWVHATLRPSQVRELGWYSGHFVAVLSIQGSDGYLQLGKDDVECLQRDGHLELLAYRTRAFKRNTPGIDADGPELVQQPSGRQTWGEIAVWAFVSLGVGAVGVLLIAGWARRRPAATPRPGLFERLGQRYPAALEHASKISLDGIGLRWIDFHDVTPDGFALATQWISFAFLPFGPVRRARIRVVSEHEAGVPLVFTVRSTRYLRTEQLPVDRSRNRRVYGFYYGVFVPLAIVPVFAGFATIVALDFKFAAWAFWLGGAVVLAIGIGAVFLERRVMGPPRRP